MDEIAGFKIEIKSHSRSRRMKLRYDAARQCAVITKPPFSSEHQAKNFAAQHISWLNDQKRKSPDIKFLLPGYFIPIAGKDHTIIHQPNDAASVSIGDRQIIVGGPIEGLSKRIENYFKKYARELIEPIASEMARKSGKNFRKIQIRDTKSRWGSCSTTGTLSFSWRLIMTPEEVLNYVIAHEVAHLSEMNHSPAFWKVVDGLVSNAKAHRRWLKSDGQKLMYILTEPL